MDGKTFREWQEDMGWSNAEVTRRLGISKDTVTTYRNKGVPPRTALMMGLAMQALAHRLEAIK